MTEEQEDDPSACQEAALNRLQSSCPPQSSYQSQITVLCECIKCLAAQTPGSANKPIVPIRRQSSWHGVGSTCTDADQSLSTLPLHIAGHALTRATHSPGCHAHWGKQTCTCPYLLAYEEVHLMPAMLAAAQLQGCSKVTPNWAAPAARLGVCLLRLGWPTALLVS